MSLPWMRADVQRLLPDCARPRSEEHTSELQSHRDLHSFPTRRSSDLAAALSTFHVSPAWKSRRTHDTSSSAGANQHSQGVGPARDHRRRVWLYPRCRFHGCARTCSGFYPIVRGRDRKSTRLNSSHTEIYTLSLHDALPIWQQL